LIVLKHGDQLDEINEADGLCGDCRLASRGKSRVNQTGTEKLFDAGCAVGSNSLAADRRFLLLRGDILPLVFALLY
jgi:hypothetical protein